MAVNSQRSFRKKSALSALLSPKNTDRKRVLKAGFLSSEAVYLIKHWNSYTHLKPLRLKGNSQGYIIQEQPKYIRKFNRYLVDLQKGRLYRTKKDVYSKFVRVPSLQQLKKVIDNYALMATSEYTDNYECFTRRYIHEIFYSPFSPPIKDKFDINSYRYRYPLLYLLNTSPQPLYETVPKVRTKYPSLVKNIVAIITKNSKEPLSNRGYNTVARCASLAMATLSKEVSQEQLCNVLPSLPSLIYKASNEKLSVETLYTVVNYKLVPYLVNNRYIIK